MARKIGNLSLTQPTIDNAIAACNEGVILARSAVTDTVNPDNILAPTIPPPGLTPVPTTAQGSTDTDHPTLRVIQQGLNNRGDMIHGRGPHVRQQR